MSRKVNQHPVILYSGGMDSFVLAGSVISHKWFSKAPVLVHFAVGDELHDHITYNLLPKQVTHLSEMAGAQVDVRVIKQSAFMISEPAQKLRRESYVTLNHKARFKCYNVGQQAVYLGLAFNHAGSLESDYVFAAFQYNKSRWDWRKANPGQDASDDGPDFVKAWNKLSDVGVFVPSQQLVTPFLDSKYTKKDIMELGRDLGMPMELTHSCVMSVPACGKCYACKRHAEGVRELGFDPRLKP
jgi:7-cyano-7-deazaguanine synthase in queuosine biosynthesis